MRNPAPEPAEAEIREIASGLLHLEGPLLPILHALQEAFGHVPAAAQPVLAELLNVSRAEIHGVVSFYHDFSSEPAGRHILRICRAEACQAMGGEALAKETLARLGVGWRGSTPNGALTVEPVYCLGLCASAPAAMLDERVVGRLDRARMDALLAEAGA